MSNDLAVFEKSLSLGSLGAYLHWVNQLPMLSLEEEQALTKNLQENNDLESARKLILSHLRLVTKIARGFEGYGLQQADLIQEGNIGLMKAVKRFDPSVGVRLMSYAIHWIRAEIHEYVIRNWKIVKVATTKAQRKLFFNLRRLTKSSKLSEADVKMVAEELNVSDNDVRTMAQRMTQYDQSFDAPADSDNDHQQAWHPENYLEDQQANPAQLLEQHNTEQNERAGLLNAISLLNERERYVIQRRWLIEKKETLHELADTLSVSAERIRQIEQNAMKKMRAHLALATDSTH